MLLSDTTVTEYFNFPLQNHFFSCLEICLHSVGSDTEIIQLTES